MSFSARTLYHFLANELTILETTDAREIDKIANGNAIEVGGILTLNETRYRVNQIAILPTHVGRADKRRTSETIGEVNFFSIQALIYITKEF
jgi:hypothetical protein